MIKRLFFRDFLGVASIEQTNRRFYFADASTEWRGAMIARDQHQIQMDTNIFFIGYFDEDGILQAFGKFTRWFSPTSWSMNHVSTRPGSNLPRIYGGRSSDPVYDIINYATELFEKEGRTKFYMHESSDPNWESLISGDHTLLKQNYDQKVGDISYLPGTYITRHNGSTYLYEGLVLSELKIIACTRK